MLVQRAAVGHDEEVFWGLHARGLAAGEDDGDESHCLVLSMMDGEDGFILILEREESWNGISHQALGGSGRQTWRPAFSATPKTARGKDWSGAIPHMDDKV